MSRLFDLSGRVALVTGGNGGIGLGMAKGLAEAGARVAIAGRNAAKNDSAAEELNRAGFDAIAIQVDLAREDACRELISRVSDRCGRLDVLVNNAGINLRKQPETYSLAEWRELIDVNLTSAFVCSQAAYPEFCRLGGGKIIMVGSMLSVFGAGFAAPYAATKGGIVQLGKSLSSAWAKDNIQVNAILPGWIETELTVVARAQLPGHEERVTQRTPAGRWGEPADLAGIAVFLASKASDFITGTAIPVDGGYSSQG